MTRVYLRGIDCVLMECEIVKDGIKQKQGVAVMNLIVHCVYITKVKIDVSIVNCTTRLDF